MLAVAGATVLLAAGCGTSGPTAPSIPPATPQPSLTGPAVAQQWFAAKAETFRQAVQNVAPFYAEDVVLDHSALGPDPVRGRVAALGLLSALWDPHHWSRRSVEPAYLSTEGAITVEQVVDITRWNPDAQLLPGSSVYVHAIGPEGITSETLAPGIGEVWAMSRNNVRASAGLDDALAAAQRYVEAWSAGAANGVAALYDADATVTDSILRITVSGPRRAAALAGVSADEGGLPGLALGTMPGSDAEAVYAAGPWGDGSPSTRVILLAKAPGAGNLAIELRLDDRGRITDERRYHRVDSLLRSSVPAHGWWDDRDIPSPVPHVQTGTVTFGSADVDIFNASPGLTEIVTWAGGRLRSAGLTPPELVSFTFQDPDVDLCAGITGQIVGGQVTLCFNDRTACVDAQCSGWEPYAKDTLLHEVGHAWIDENVSPASREEFLRSTGLPTWDSTRYPWAERGCEIAAITFAWALMDEPFPLNARFGSMTCDQLAANYETLTGSAPPAHVPCTD
jgi:hypothetical protein